jgi:hypothetical protein
MQKSHWGWGVFDEEYPGFIDNIEISYCPMCGRKLREE